LRFFAMAKRQEDGERNKKIVGELMKLADNQLCADCGAKGALFS